MPDHSHMLVEINPTRSISVLTKKVKSISKKWDNKKWVLKNKLEWQED